MPRASRRSRSASRSRSADPPVAERSQFRDGRAARPSRLRRLRKRMSAYERFKAGQLAEAIAAQGEIVKQRPTDADARFQLFVFLCFAGELERAEKHLDALDARDATLRRGGVLFRNLLASELQRP